MHSLNREDCARLDAADPLAPLREKFDLPDGVIYLDGNSLGPLPRAAKARVERVISEEWAKGLIRSWNTAGWIELPQRVGAAIASIIGAQPDEVIAADSTSVNLFKVLSAALAARPERRVIVSEPDNFPTDLYIAEGVIGQLRAKHELRLTSRVEEALGPDTAVLMLTHVNYRTGAMHDMARLTKLAHDHGALVVWDLSHSAGAVPVDLDAAGADFAVGCGYKFLNGGPGAPAYLYVARRHRQSFTQPLSGWLGHAAPFAFEPAYRPAEGVSRYVCGTPAVLAMSALEEAVNLMRAVDMREVRAKSIALADLFIQLVEERCAGQGLRLVSPREAAKRGSQVSIAHAEGYALMQALIARGVIGDFRPPDIARFGITPLYLRYVDVFDAVEILRDVLATKAWDRAEYKRRAAVT
ncbi:MAG TPA: kynureninase [Burkholderiales bacterium]|nr:kynureninase [Burkholderiales bacterium]